MNSQFDLLSVTGFFSVIAHLVIIAGITFKMPESVPRDDKAQTLDIVLLDVNNDEKPEQAELISNSNNFGGGENDINASSKIASTPRNPAPIKEIKKVAKEQTQTLIEDEILTVESEVAVVKKKADTVLKNNSKTKGKDVLTTKTQRQLEIERLRATIRQASEDYSKMPRRLYLSPSTKFDDAAEYLTAWVKKVKLVGSLEYEKRLKGVTGQVMVDVAINKNGRIDSVEILQASDKKVINQSIIRIIHQASPFKPLSEKLRKHGDIVHITRMYYFDANVGMQSKATKNSR